MPPVCRYTARDRDILCSLLKTQTMQFLGNISYGMYLFQQVGAHTHRACTPGRRVACCSEPTQRQVVTYSGMLVLIRRSLTPTPASWGFGDVQVVFNFISQTSVFFRQHHYVQVRSCSRPITIHTCSSIQ